MDKPTTLEIHDDPMPYDEACAECGKTVAIVLTVRDWTDNHNGYPTTHLLCKTCAEVWNVRLAQLLKKLSGWRNEALALLQAGRKIDAIKLCRHETGMSLKDSKAAVENLE